MYDIERDLTRRLTLTKDDEDTPTPSPDGRLIAYSATTCSRDTIAATRHYSIKTIPFDGLGAPG